MRQTRKREHEKLDEANLDRVIEMLEGDEPITKKVACEMLNISYNTTRLGSILAEHKDIMEYRATRKAQNRGRKATDLEKRDAIERYLNGQTVSEIAKSMFRSTTFIRNLIDNIGVPQKITKSEMTVYRYKTPMLPEQCVAESFDIGERVWSAHDNAMAIIKKEAVSKTTNYVDKYSAKCYQIFVITMTDFETKYFGYQKIGGYWSHSLTYDLGSLRHLKEYGIDIYK
jgi:transposase